jgi:hypothetical protein
MNEWFELVQRKNFTAIFSGNGNLYHQHMAQAKGDNERE